jgi:hypothetical protein
MRFGRKDRSGPKRRKPVSAERFGMEEKMKEKWNELKVTLTETTEMSKREFVLSLMVCLLGGIVFGMLFSPRKTNVFGSHNGNNCGNTRLNEEDEGEIADWDEIEKQEL